MAEFFSHTDWAVVLATVVGPIAAVAISIWLDRRARQRERRMAVINSLIHGWTIAPLVWNQGMLQVPLEFGRKVAVMERWADCNKAAAEQRMSPELRDGLIKAAMAAVGFPERLAGEAVRAMYRTNGVIELENLQRNALNALPDIAAAASRSAGAAESMLDLIRRSSGGEAQA
jgi:hypothetical protein